MTTYLTLLQILKIPQAFVTNACGIFRIWRRLSVQQFEMMSQTQQVLFNVNVALVDPASYENARPLIKEVFDFFTLSMESMDASLARVHPFPVRKSKNFFEEGLAFS